LPVSEKIAKRAPLPSAEFTEKPKACVYVLRVRERPREFVSINQFAIDLFRSICEYRLPQAAKLLIEPDQRSYLKIGQLRGYW
jgi:hypothetical protein